MAEQEETPMTGTPLVPEGMQQYEEAELKLPTNEDLLAEADDEKKKDGDADTDPDTVEPDGEGADDDAKAPEVQNQVEYIDDPGEFTPGDYSFDVTVYDAEGKNGKPVKVTSLEQWDDLLESDPNLGSSAAVARAFRAQSRMERGQEDDKKVYEAKRAEYDQAVQAQEQQSSTINQWVAEMDYLIAKKELPPISAQLRNANWSDPEVSKQPAVKAQIEVLNYMRDENNARTKLGLPAISSVLDAYEGFARQREKTTVAEAKKAQGEARREAGAKVASGSPRPATTIPKGVSVGRPGVIDRW